VGWQAWREGNEEGNESIKIQIISFRIFFLAAVRFLYQKPQYQNLYTIGNFQRKKARKKERKKGRKKETKKDGGMQPKVEKMLQVHFNYLYLQRI
jgi:hypothetical protein